MRIEKNSIVSEINAMVKDSPFVLLTDFSGMRVDHFNELRSRLMVSKSEYRVVKNTLLKRALHELELPEFDGELSGQTAVVLGERDVTAAAKVLKNFTAEFSKPTIKLGIMDRNLITKDQIMALADLPSREVILGKLLGLLNAPASQLARVINTPAAQLAQVIRAHADAKGEKA